VSEGTGSRSVVERIAENRILQAMEEGAFDDLPGTGQPIADIDEPYDPLWWVRQWMRRERLETVRGATRTREVVAASYVAGVPLPAARPPKD